MQKGFQMAEQTTENTNAEASRKTFFNAALKDTDPAIYEAIQNELHRQQNQIELIASENIVSQAVMDAQGSVMTNKYAEGYPGRRYYGGCEFVDVAEQLAIDRACALFKCKFANVQPHSGSQANQSVFMALLQPGDKIMGMSLPMGGHLTHGAAPNQSGKWFEAVQYGVRKDDGLLDYEEIEALAVQERPKLIIAGATVYSRVIDWARFRQIADKVGAYLMADIAHYSGLIAAGVYPSPIEYADVVTTTTHKSIRGPRGGLVLTNNEEIAKKINSAMFPGLQGGPLMHVIAAKAVAFGEALKPEFKAYAQAVIDNARVLAATIQKGGLDIVSGGTDSHVFSVDLRKFGVNGKQAQEALDRAGLTCNKNTIPFDPEKPMIGSGIRLGTPAGTTRGFGTKEFEMIGEMIIRVLKDFVKNGEDGNKAVEQQVRKEVVALCQKFPIYDVL